MIRGTRIIPNTSAASTKMNIRNDSEPISPMSVTPVVAMPESTVIMTTAAKSSTTEIAMMSREERMSCFPKSFKICTTRAVLVTCIAPPRKRESIDDQPSNLPNPKPRLIIANISANAMITAVAPMWRTVLQLNSMPTPNRSSTKPISASKLMV